MLTDQEVVGLALEVAAKHDARVVRLAAMAHVASKGFDRIQQPEIRQRLVSLADACVHAYTRERGLDRFEFENALQALQRAEKVARYLGSLPD